MRSLGWQESVSLESKKGQRRLEMCQGLKPDILLGRFAARLKPCPDTKRVHCGVLESVGRLPAEILGSALQSRTALSGSEGCAFWACFQGVEQAAEKGRISSEKLEKHTSGAEAHIDFIGFMPGINPRPTARMSFPQHLKPGVDSYWSYGTTKVVPLSHICGTICVFHQSNWANVLSSATVATRPH
jgi:hypothetical protein